MPIPVPYAITRRDDGLLIEWDETGHRALYLARALRLACPCAACVEEMTGRQLLDPAAVPAGVRPVSVALEPPQHHHLQEMSDVQAVGRGIDADIQRPGLREPFDRGRVAVERRLLDQAAPAKLADNRGHDR